MGDDVHLRTQATTNLLIRNLLPSIAGLGNDPESVAMSRFLATCHLFFLTIAMAGAKSLTLAAEKVKGGTVVTTMARNGTTFGVKIAGSDTWHICEAPPVGNALYYSGYTEADAARDVGDSAVLELIGLGGAAAAGSPAVAGFLGGSMEDSARAKCAGSVSPRAPGSSCPPWTSAAHLWGSTFARSSRPGSDPRSPPGYST